MVNLRLHTNMEVTASMIMEGMTINTRDMITNMTISMIINTIISTSIPMKTAKNAPTITQNKKKKPECKVTVG